MSSPSDSLAFLTDLRSRCGDTAQYETAFGPVHFFNRPEHVAAIFDADALRRTDLVKLVLGRGLLSSDGDFWRKQRRLMQPEFTRLRSEKFAELVTRSTGRLLRSWKPQMGTGEVLDLAPAMTELTLEVIVAALFSVELKDEGPDLVESITVLIEGLGARAGMTFNQPLRVTPEEQRNFTAALADVDAFCARIVEARRRALAEGERAPQDLLGILMTAPKEPLTDPELRDEVVTMLISGHETTALILSWTWALLATHPSVETALQKEVDDLLQGRAPTLADMPQLALTQRVLLEAMRLYPPVWFIARKAIEDVDVGNNLVPKDGTVLICTYLVHRHEEFWPDPDKFDPDRFLPEAVSARPRGAYFPFAGGRHTCLGQKLAMLEGTLILAQLVQSVRVRPEGDPFAQIDPAITLRPRRGLKATLESRAGTSHPE
jgi:cytochrome P450